MLGRDSGTRLRLLVVLPAVFRRPSLKSRAERRIGGVTQSVCALVGIEARAAPVEDSFAPVVAKARFLSIERCEQVLFYAPDAIDLQSR